MWPDQLCSIENNSDDLHSKFLSARLCASAVLTEALCLFVCFLQVGVLSKRLNGSSSFSAQRLPSTYTVLKGYSGISKNKGGPLWNFVFLFKFNRNYEAISYRFRNIIAYILCCYPRFSIQIFSVCWFYDVPTSCIWNESWIELQWTYFQCNSIQLLFQTQEVETS